MILSIDKIFVLQLIPKTNSSNIDKIYLLFTASVCGSLRKNNLAATICTIITIIVLISDGLKRNKKTICCLKSLTKQWWIVSSVSYGFRERNCRPYSFLKKKILGVLILFAEEFFLFFSVNLRSERLCIILYHYPRNKISIQILNLE